LLPDRVVPSPFLPLFRRMVTGSTLCFLPRTIRCATQCACRLIYKHPESGFLLPLAATSTHFQTTQDSVRPRLLALTLCLRCRWRPPRAFKCGREHELLSNCSKIPTPRCPPISKASAFCKSIYVHMHTRIHTHAQHVHLTHAYLLEQTTPNILHTTGMRKCVKSTLQTLFISLSIASVSHTASTSKNK